MPSGNVATVLTLPHPRSLGGRATAYPPTTALDLLCSLPSRLDIHLPMIVRINHRRRARCGPLVMCIWGRRRSDSWIRPILPLVQPRARPCFLWDIAKLESVRWHRLGFILSMAIRMAQDLGLHKNADQWTHSGVSLFTPVELQERRRIWYAFVIMDKYVSTYVGRPLSILERDFDTELPSIDEVCLVSCIKSL